MSERRASPVQRLKTVLNWTPEQATRPFEALDALYTNILLNAKEAYEAVDAHSGRDFLLLFRVYHVNVSGFQLGSGFTSQYPPDRLSALLRLEPQAEETLVSDLRSLVALETDEHDEAPLRLYHKSFSDFFEEESRAKDLFVPPSRVYTHLAKCCMQHILECPLFLDPRE